jgi:outer membrane lipoprotein carrier protein
MKRMFLGCVLLSVTQVLWGATASDVLWDKLRAIRSMNASFTQRISSKSHDISKSYGSMAFERPGHFRWHTDKPMEQLLIADGEKIWLYDVDLEQVTIKPQTGVMGAAAGLFLDDDSKRLAHDFQVTQEQQDLLDVFQLQAISKQANIQRMTLRFEGAELRGMDLYDQLGQRTTVNFKQIETNPTLSASLFRFSPPSGVDVVEQ